MASLNNYCRFWATLLWTDAAHTYQAAILVTRLFCCNNTSICYWLCGQSFHLLLVFMAWCCLRRADPLPLANEVVPSRSSPPLTGTDRQLFMRLPDKSLGAIFIETAWTVSELNDVVAQHTTTNQ